LSESTQRSGGAPAAVAAVLFACLFAAQASVIALSPVLPAVAADLHVSTAGAGQLRTVLGLAAGITALAVGRAAGRLSLRALLLVGVGLLAGGSAASAAAPTFAVLALAQVVIGSGVAIVVAAGSAAAAEWTAPEHRARVLSWALMGQPASWIVGMPLVGVLGGTSWRLGWIVLPVLAATVAAIGVAKRPAAAAPVVAQRSRDVLADPGVRGWALSELLVNSGWAGTLVYVGALCADVHGASPTAVGFVLAAGAAAFVAGNLAFRRFVGTDVRAKLIGLAPAIALGVLLLGTMRASLAVTAVIFSAAAFAAGGRALLGSAYGLELAPERRLAVMGIRAAATQFGYFAGTAIAGAALAAYGWTGFGVSASLLLAVSPLPLLAAGGLRLRPAVISV
jgi:predicted MFS family arabinose efflux permease